MFTFSVKIVCKVDSLVCTLSHVWEDRGRERKERETRKEKRKELGGKERKGWEGRGRDMKIGEERERENMRKKETG